MLGGLRGTSMLKLVGAIEMSLQPMSGKEVGLTGGVHPAKSLS